MKITIEIIASLILIVMGYIAICNYLKEGNLKSIKLSIAMPNKNKCLYLSFAIISFALLITLFNTLYSANTLIHQMKLLILIAMIFPIAAIDHKLQKIPNQFIIAALIFRVVLYIIEFLQSTSSAIEVMKDSLIGALVIGLFFFLILIIFKNSIGMGDVKLFAIMGIYQGLWGAVNSVFFSLLVSFFLSLGLLITRKKKRKETISFGPSILVGTIIAIGLSGI